LFGAVSGDEFFTDANSLTMVKRVRGLRSAFAAAPLADEHMANPIGGNYFPVTLCIQGFAPLSTACQQAQSGTVNLKGTCQH
jgi:hypothetical protein